MVSANEAAGRLGARAQAQPGRAAEAREGAARDPRRAAGADRRRLRERRRGGRRPAAVVGPLPRQAEDRDVHAPGQGAGRAARRRPSCARSARSRTSTASGDGELSTRQNIQLHWLELAQLPDVFAAPRARRASRPPAAAATPCATSPAARCRGSPPTSSSTRRRRSTAAADLFYGNPDWANLPRKHKYSISACADRCNAPEINCISLIGTVHEGREGFAVLVGGGLSSVPRIARDDRRLRPEGGGERDPRRDHARSGRRICSYRVSRVKARLKFMVDDIGPEGIRERVEARLGRKLERLRAAADHGRALAPPRRPPAEAGRALLHRRSRPPRPRSRATR